MAIAQITFNPEELTGKLNELEKVIIPNIVYKSLNRAVFRTSREDLRDAAKNTFIHKNTFTLKSFLYDKPTETSEGLESRIYIRDDAPKGNAPADYLSPQIAGGPVYKTRFQRRLQAKSVLGPYRDKYMMPALGTIGRSRLPKGEYTRALWGMSLMNDLRGGFDYDKKAFKTAGKYVWVPPDLADQIGAEAHAKLVRRLNRTGVGPTEPYQIPKAGIYKVKGGKKNPSLEQRFISLPYVPSVPGKFNFQEIAVNSLKGNFRDELLKNLRR